MGVVSSISDKIIDAAAAAAATYLFVSEGIKSVLFAVSSSLPARAEQRDKDTLATNNADDCKCPWASRPCQAGKEAPAFALPIPCWAERERDGTTERND